jgi:hypothetical protein
MPLNDLARQMTPRVESRHDRCITEKTSDGVRGNSRASTSRSETKTLGFAVLRDGRPGERSGSPHHRAMSHSNIALGVHSQSEADRHRSSFVDQARRPTGEPSPTASRNGYAGTSGDVSRDGRVASAARPNMTRPGFQFLAKGLRLQVCKDSVEGPFFAPMQETGAPLRYAPATRRHTGNGPSRDAPSPPAPLPQGARGVLRSGA